MDSFHQRLSNPLMSKSLIYNHILNVDKTSRHNNRAGS